MTAETLSVVVGHTEALVVAAEIAVPLSSTRATAENGRLPGMPSEENAAVASAPCGAECFMGPV